MHYLSPQYDYCSRCYLLFFTVAQINAAATLTTIIYTGEILNTTIATTTAMGISAVNSPIFAFLHRDNTGKAIRAITTGRTPWNTLFTTVLSLNLTKNADIKSIIVKAGRQVDITHNTAPFFPKNRFPINIEILTAKIPGDI